MRSTNRCRCSSTRTPFHKELLKSTARSSCRRIASCLLRRQRQCAGQADGQHGVSIRGGKVGCYNTSNRTLSGFHTVRCAILAHCSVPCIVSRHTSATVRIASWLLQSIPTRASRSSTTGFYQNRTLKFGAEQGTVRPTTNEVSGCKVSVELRKPSLLTIPMWKGTELA